MLIVLGILVPLLMAGLAAGNAPLGDSRSEPDVTLPVATTDGVWHRVHEDETLRSIAARYYGSARHWRTLQVVNDAAIVPGAGRMLWIPGLRDEVDALVEHAAAR